MNGFKCHVYDIVGMTGKQDPIKMHIKFQATILLSSRRSNKIHSVFYLLISLFLSYCWKRVRTGNWWENQTSTKSDNRKAENQLNASTVYLRMTSGILIKCVGFWRAIFVVLFMSTILKFGIYLTFFQMLVCFANL